MELHRDVPWMRRQFHDLDELAVERPAHDFESVLSQRLLQAVELIAMAMPLMNDVLAVELA